MTAFAAVNRAVANSVPGCLGRGLATERTFLLWKQQGELLWAYRRSWCDPDDGGDSSGVGVGGVNVDMVKGALCDRAFLWHPKYTGLCFLGIPERQRSGHGILVRGDYMLLERQPRMALAWVLVCLWCSDGSLEWGAALLSITEPHPQPLHKSSCGRMNLSPRCSLTFPPVWSALSALPEPHRGGGGGAAETKQGEGRAGANFCS